MDKTAQAAQVARQIEARGDLFTFQGNTFYGLPKTTEPITSEYETNPNDQDYVDIEIARHQANPVPGEQDFFTDSDGGRYRVVSVRKPPGTFKRRLRCEYIDG